MLTRHNRYNGLVRANLLRTCRLRCGLVVDLLRGNCCNGCCHLAVLLLVGCAVVMDTAVSDTETETVRCAAVCWTHSLRGVKPPKADNENSPINSIPSPSFPTPYPSKPEIIKISTSVITQQPTSCSTCKVIHIWTSFVFCCWNSLPEYLRDPELPIHSFRRQLKTFLFAQY